MYPEKDIKEREQKDRGKTGRGGKECTVDFKLFKDLNGDKNLLRSEISNTY